MSPQVPGVLGLHLPMGLLVRIWESRSGELLATFEHQQEVTHVSIDSSGARIVTMEKSGLVHIRDATPIQRDFGMRP